MRWLLQQKITNVTCNGQNDGKNIVAIGGTGQIKYSISTI
jgi:hypothetical protein